MSLTFKTRVGRKTDGKLLYLYMKSEGSYDSFFIKTLKNISIMYYVTKNVFLYYNWLEQVVISVCNFMLRPSTELIKTRLLADDMISPFGI